MALIKCPECGKEISDKASACPNCGCPVDYRGHEEVFDDNDNVMWHEDDESPQTKEKDKWTDYIVGFRSGNPLHMVIAGLIYVGCIVMLIVGDEPLLKRFIDVILVIGSIYLFSVFFQPPSHTKRWFYALIGVILIALGTISNTLVEEDNPTNTTLPAYNTQQQQSETNSYNDTGKSSTNATTEENDGSDAYGNYVTYEMFSQMSEGMTLYEIRNLTGQQGELLSSSGNVEMWTFDGKGISNATITFIDGKLSSKAQIGLE